MTNSSLHQRASATRLRLAEAEQQEKDAAEIGAIETARARAERARDVLSHAFWAKATLEEEGVAVTPIASQRRKEAVEARRALRSAASAFSDPEVPLTKRLNGDSVQKALKQADSLGVAFQRALNAVVDSERVRLCPSDLTEPIPDIPGKDLTVVKLKNLRNTLSTAVEGMPPSDLPEKLRKVRSAAEIWAQLRPALKAEVDQLPVAIRTFVEAASTDEGAKWSHLTAEVRKWLDTAGNGDEYRVRRC